MLNTRRSRSTALADIEPSEAEGLRSKVRTGLDLVRRATVCICELTEKSAARVYFQGGRHTQAAAVDSR